MNFIDAYQPYLQWYEIKLLQWSLLMPSNHIYNDVIGVLFYIIGFISHHCKYGCEASINFIVGVLFYITLNMANIIGILGAY